MSDIRITNESGQVAVKWIMRRELTHPVKIDGTNTAYTFVPKMNVWMAWVKPEHVDRLLAHKEKSCNCNNGTYRNAFMLANRLDVNLWVYGNRDGKPS